MNILTSITSLFSRFTRAATPEPMPSAPPVSPPPPAPPEPAPPEPVPPQEISCFVKGLIRSMEIESDKWVLIGSRNLHGWPKYGWQHASEGIYVSEDGDKVTNSGGCGIIHRPNDVEEVALKAAVLKHLAAPLAEQQESQRLAMLAAKRAPFEKLGCPEKTS